MLLVKAPVPVPSVVLESEMVGVPVAFQQTPYAVTEAPPSEVTLPPEDALEEEMEETAVVATSGALLITTEYSKALFVYQVLL
jgi:hypothetical protein